MRITTIQALLLSVGLIISAAPVLAIPRFAANVVRGFPGRTVDVPLTLRYRTNDVRDVVAFQADLVFDATGLTDSAPARGAIASNHVLSSSAPFTGTRRLLAYSTVNSVFTNGEMARIPFTVAANEFRNFSLRLTNVILVRADASRVSGTTADGAVVISSVYLAPGGNADGFLNVATNGAEQCYIIQATTDFRSWVNVHTNSTDTGLLQFADPQAGGFPKRFYRAVVCDAGNGLQIGTITQLPGGRFQFDFAGAPGRSYVIQASTNLSDWRDLDSVRASAGPVNYTNTIGPAVPYRFFRVRVEP